MLVLPAEDKDIPQRILEHNEHAVIEGQIPGGSLWVKLLTSGLPLLLIVGLWLLIMRQMQAGGNRAFSFGKSRARMFGGDRPRVTFRKTSSKLRSWTAKATTPNFCWIRPRSNSARSRG